MMRMRMTTTTSKFGSQWGSYDHPSTSRPSDAPSNASRDDDDEDDDDDEGPKNCFKIAENRVCCSFGYIIRYIGTTNARKKVLWVYSHLKSDFFRIISVKN